MQDVAQAAGVSPMTVSNCFSNPQRVQPRTLELVLQVAADLGYVPNLSARSLSAGENRVIGAVLPSMRNSSFYHYSRGLRDEAARRKHRVITMIAETPEEEYDAVATLLGLRVAGIALVAGSHLAELQRLLVRSGTPVAEAWGGEEAIGLGVGYDVYGASLSLTRHLVSTGRRRIGFVDVAGGGGIRYAMRLPAFRSEIFAAGLSDDLIVSIRAADGFGAGAQILDALLAREPRLDAIMCPTDVVAAGAVFACARRGLAVPGDVAVCGWGDYDIGREMAPRLTTIAPYSDRIGIGIVSALIDDPEPQDERARLTTAHELLIRESTVDPGDSRTT